MYMHMYIHVYTNVVQTREKAIIGMGYRGNTVR